MLIWPENRMLINLLQKCPEKLAHYIFQTPRQAQKREIATSCVSTRYPHYVPLTLNHVSLCARRNAFRTAPLKCAGAAQFRGHARDFEFESTSII
jgi:hypothetical protein